MSETILRNVKGKIMTVGDLENVSRYLKHGVKDGKYKIDGPRINMTCYRLDGIIFPAGGNIEGKLLPTLTPDQAVEFFGKTPLAEQDPILT